MSFKDHFSTQAAVYAQSRPTYPAAWFAELARLTPGHDLAWDAGAGNGQASVGLAAQFAQVIATEPSAAQLAEATAHPKVKYLQSAETAPMIADGTVDLVTVAQAVHWFDRPKFYTEVKRVLRPGGVVALWAYELGIISPEIDAAVRRFYKGAIKDYWPAERVHIETAYRDFEFPFRELPWPKAEMQLDWTLANLAAYLRSWSAVVRYRKERGIDPVEELERELAPIWGAGARRVTWPLVGRLGRV